MRIKDFFATSDKKESLGNRFREKRINYFKTLVDGIERPITILDVGGAEMTWINSGFGGDSSIEITLLNLSKSEVQSSNIKSVIGDATDLSQYGDNEFDIVFSNSVIEHLHNKENQVKMANEVMRVGKLFYIQTPNKYFFLEPHYLLPFFQFLPKKVQYSILTKTKLSRGRKWTKDQASRYTDEIILLSKKQMRKLFPGSRLYNERFFGLLKSFTAHNFLNN